jgi:Xaa-Pro aminopeptidase
LYGFYLGVYEAVLYAIKPGLTSQQILQAALPKMDAILEAARFSKPLYIAAAKQFVDRYRTSAGRGGNLGHAVGMATHDFGGGSGTMRPGLVFTIEPEFRIPEEQIFIRLEDMIVITESGATILSDFVPRSVDGVEKVIAQPGLLQQYGRIR